MADEDGPTSFDEDDGLEWLYVEDDFPLAVSLRFGYLQQPTHERGTSVGCMSEEVLTCYVSG